MVWSLMVGLSLRLQQMPSSISRPLSSALTSAPHEAVVPLTKAGSAVVTVTPSVKWAIGSDLQAVSINIAVAIIRMRNRVAFMSLVF